MHWILYAVDKPGMLPTRLANVDKHRAYLAAHPIRTLVSGPLVDDAGNDMQGSFFLVEADTRAEVEDFNRNDPFWSLGIWETVRIHAFYKRVDDRAAGAPQ
ncbi:YciI family protein [Cupriavidus necator]|uniref:YciI family protein n=1 Tax=Cupriavidus necator TaxID=106590 RepID=A0A1U9ULF5_CUPNE|nr:YciI family protein [Cupriavidus necator]AQV93544.1 YciI family protein [Cupriavidus necator]